MSESFAQRMEKARLALMAHIIAVRDAKINEITSKADLESRRIIGAARERARAQLHDVISEERRRREHQRRTALGEAEHALRSLRHRLILSTLDTALTKLKDRLLQLWTDADAQARWLNITLATAEKRLDPGTWRLEYPRHWDPRQGEGAIASFTTQHKATHLELRPNPEIICGYRIVCGGTSIDSSLSGIFNDVDEIKGRLLGVLEKTPAWPVEQLLNQPGGGDHGDE
jgi:vacuolar-type H+-ATPase subunit E/Vma4